MIKWIDTETVKIIEKILEQGKTVEIRRRKNEIIIVEVSGKIKKHIVVDERR